MEKARVNLPAGGVVGHIGEGRVARRHPYAVTLAAMQAVSAGAGPARFGTRTANTGQTRPISPEKWGTPWPDGSRVMWHDSASQGSTGDKARIVVRRSRGLAVLMNQVFDG